MVQGNRKVMFAFGLVVICIILGALGQISMKNGMNQLNEIESVKELLDLRTIIDVISNKYVFSGLVLYAVGAFLWLGALSTLEVSFMYPMLSLAYVVTALFALAFLGESVTLFRWAGIALIVIGCFLIAKS